MRPARVAMLFRFLLPPERKGESGKTKRPPGFGKPTARWGEERAFASSLAGRGRRCGPDATRRGKGLRPNRTEVTMNTNPTLQDRAVKAAARFLEVPRLRDARDRVEVARDERNHRPGCTRSRVRRPRVRRRLRAPELRRRLRRREERSRDDGAARGLLARRERLRRIGRREVRQDQHDRRRRGPVRCSGTTSTPSARPSDLRARLGRPPLDGGGRLQAARPMANRHPMANGRY